MMLTGFQLTTVLRFLASLCTTPDDYEAIESALIFRGCEFQIGKCNNVSLDNLLAVYYVTYQ